MYQEVCVMFLLAQPSVAQVWWLKVSHPPCRPSILRRPVKGSPLGNDPWQPMPQHPDFQPSASASSIPMLICGTGSTVGMSVCVDTAPPRPPPSRASPSTLHRARSRRLRPCVDKMRKCPLVSPVAPLSTASYISPASPSRRSDGQGLGVQEPWGAEQGVPG
jgi:hypothetical protein